MYVSQTGSYYQRNVHALSVIRAYNTTIPVFLHNRPPKFIRHYLKRLPPASSVSAQHIGEVGDGNFEVQSNSGEAVYKVYFKSTSTVSATWCDCADWSRRHRPCKHLLGVTSHCLSTVGLGSAASRIHVVVVLQTGPRIIAGSR